MTRTSARKSESRSVRISLDWWDRHRYPSDDRKQGTQSRGVPHGDFDSNVLKSRIGMINYQVLHLGAVVQVHHHPYADSTFTNSA